MIKKIIALALVLILIIPSGVGCSRSDDGDITVLCTVFPVYDWVRNVVGESERVKVKLLISNGADMHSYQPTAADVVSIRSADMIVRVGGESDSFLEDILKNSPDGDRIDLELIEASGVVLREISSSYLMGGEHTHGDGEDCDHVDVDEHIWLSLRNACASVEAICSALSSIDADGAEGYRQRADGYISRLSALDAEYAEAVASSESPRVLFADRFPFVYLMEDHGIEYAAAFEGCTTEVDATFQTVVRLSDKLNEWGLRYISVTESSDRELAESVARASEVGEVTVLAFDSLQSVRASDIASGKTYIGAMENNLEVLREAISAHLDR